eukprot:TRINITY_DN5921_c0_g1_i3.p2 TRINITY_DN5921_c0_g1~~TRINITY_DN5921_c0_g1_i3.p2  ORF type:complete len:782 (+),score=203.03 TRINITY_DN5921_c0_g1_i3:188-2533(+)
MKQFSFDEIGEASRGFAEVSQIGKGAQGMVYMGVLDGVRVAIKVFADESEDIEKFRNYVRFLGRVCEESIAGIPKVFGWTEEPLKCLVYPYFDSGDFHTRLCATNTEYLPMTWESRIFVLQRVSEIVSKLHGKGLYHGDLWSGNVFLNRTSDRLRVDHSPSSSPSSSVVVLSSNSTHHFGFDVYVSDFWDSMVGSELHPLSFPSVDEHGKVDPEKHDVFGFGMIIFETLVGRSIDRNDETLRAFLKDGFLRSDALDQRSGKIPLSIGEIVEVGLNCLKMIIRMEEAASAVNDVMNVLLVEKKESESGIRSSPSGCSDHFESDGACGDTPRDSSSSSSSAAVEMCVVCLNRPRATSIHIRPCGHSILCVSCATALESRVKDGVRCPLCHEEVSKIDNIARLLPRHIMKHESAGSVSSDATWELQSVVRQAKKFILMGKFNECVELIEPIIAEGVQGHAYYKILCMRAFCCIYLFDVEKGIEYASEALRRRPKVAYLGYISRGVLRELASQDGSDDIEKSYGMMDALRGSRRKDPFFMTITAFSMLENKKYSVAVECASDALRTDEEAFLALELRGLSRVRLGEFGDATRDFMQLLDHDPANFGGHMGMGVAAMERGDYSAAVEHFTGATNANRRAANAYLQRAKCYVEMKKLSKAMHDYTKALQIYPSYFSALLERGELQNKMKEYEGAIKDFDVVCELREDTVKAYRGRGLAYAGLGKTRKAVEDLTHAIEMRPTVAELYYHRGMLFKNMNKMPLAREDLDRAIELNPRSTKFHVARNGLH